MSAATASTAIACAIASAASDLTAATDRVIENLKTVLNNAHVDPSMEPRRAMYVLYLLVRDVASALAPISHVEAIVAALVKATQVQDNGFLVQALMDKANSYPASQPWRKLVYLETALIASALPKSVHTMSKEELAWLGVGQQTRRFATMTVTRNKYNDTVPQSFYDDIYKPTPIPIAN